MAFETINDAGLTWLWCTFGFMAASALAILLLTFFAVPASDRTHGLLSGAILTIAATAYYTMAINQGYVMAGVDSNLSVQRSIYWARYVDWFLTTPLLLLEVLLYSGLPILQSLWIIGADIAMILLGLFAALESSSQGFRWGYYAISCFMQLIIINGLVAGFRSLHLRAPRVRLAYIGSAVYLGVLWLGYPIVFGLAEGSNTISVFAEVGAYSVLDLFTKVVFGWGIMATVFFLKGSYEEEYASGKYKPDIFGAPVYAPLSTTRAAAEHPLKGDRHGHRGTRTADAAAPAADTKPGVATSSTTTGTGYNNGTTTAV